MINYVTLVVLFNNHLQIILHVRLWNFFLIYNFHVLPHLSTDSIIARTRGNFYTG